METSICVAAYQHAVVRDGTKVEDAAMDRCRCG
jgi:hypothetical protein